MHAEDAFRGTVVDVETDVPEIHAVSRRWKSHCRRFKERGSNYKPFAFLKCGNFSVSSDPK